MLAACCAVAVTLFAVPAVHSATSSVGDVPTEVQDLTRDTPVTTRANSRPWPTKRITYSDETVKPRHVAAAVRQWNNATTGLRLIKAPRGKGKIRIRALQCPANTTPCAYYPSSGGDVYMGRSWGSRTSFSDATFDEWQLPLLIHEIGHALGLTHRSGCSVMQPYLNTWASECRSLGNPYGSGYAACAPQRVDASAIARMYRTSVRPGVGRCRSEQATASLATGQVTLSESALNAGNYTTIRLVNRSRFAWSLPYAGRAVSIVGVDAAGRVGRGFCGGWNTGSVLSAERVVRPGGIATFRVPLCHYDGTATYRFRTEYQSAFGGMRYGSQVFATKVTIDRAPSGWINIDWDLVEQVAPNRVRYYFRADVEDNGPVTYAWNFGDPASGAANTSALATPNHTFTSPGEYTVTLVLTDSIGQKHTATYYLDIWQ